MLEDVHNMKQDGGIWPFSNNKVSGDDTSKKLDQPKRNSEETNNEGGVQALLGETDGEAKQKNTGAISEAFGIIYKICAILCILILTILTFVTVADVIAFLVKEAMQRFKMANDNSFMNNGSTDVVNMKYLLNNPEDEPYSVFLEQKLLTGMVMIIGFAVSMLGIQIAILVSMKIYKAARGDAKDNESISIPFIYIGILIICFIAALVFNGVYKSDFLGGTQATMKNIKTQMRNVKSYMYSNMSNDSALLNGLKSDDTTAIIQAMKKNVKNIPALKRMIFTYNVYQYFTRIVVESDPNYETMMQMFTYEGIQKQKIDPTMFLLYKQANYVSDGYASGLRDSIKLPYGDDITILSGLNSTMKEFNRRIAKIQNIGNGKSNLFKYIWKAMVVSIMFFGIIVAIVMVVLLKDLPPIIQNFLFSLFFQPKNNSA